MVGSTDVDEFDEESSSGLCALYNSLMYSTVEDWLKIVAHHLVLTDSFRK